MATSWWWTSTANVRSRSGGWQGARATLSFANARYPAYRLDSEALVDVWGFVSGSVNPRRRAVRG